MLIRKKIVTAASSLSSTFLSLSLSLSISLCIYNSSWDNTNFYILIAPFSQTLSTSFYISRIVHHRYYLQFVISECYLIISYRCRLYSARVPFITPDNAAKHAMYDFRRFAPWNRYAYRPASYVMRKFVSSRTVIYSKQLMSSLISRIWTFTERSAHAISIKLLQSQKRYE